MKRLVATVLVGALSTPGCALRLTTLEPRVVHGASMWGNVVSLPPNTLVRVFTRATWLEGALIAADDVDCGCARNTGTSCSQPITCCASIDYCERNAAAARELFSELPSAPRRQSQ